MAEELKDILWDKKSDLRQNAILDMKHVKGIEAPVVKALEDTQSLYQANKLSFVIAAMHQDIVRSCSNVTGFDRLNAVPTVAEAIDFVMMEELERELSDPEI